MISTWTRANTPLRHVDKPWGFYAVYFESPFALIKLLHLAAGQETSLQFHEKRSEVWVVLKGRPTVLLPDIHDKLQPEVLSEGDRRDVPAYTTHQIKNLTDTSVELLELWQGFELDESDITRISDKYSRN
jgi:mannose-6-phosphate isomerase-like protein (cupin superfamily)